MNRQRQKKALRAELHYMRRRFVAKMMFCDACEAPISGRDARPGTLVLAVLCACSGLIVGLAVGGVL